MASKSQNQALAHSPPCAENLAISEMDVASLRKLMERVSARINELNKQSRKCLNCTHDFAPKRPWQKYCSKKCSNDHFWKTHEVVPTEKKEVELE